MATRQSRTAVAVFVLCFILLATIPGVAATFCVALDGIDTNDGSDAAPWRTFAVALDNLAPGDTLYLRGGTYTDAHLLNVTCSGTEAAPITIAAYPGETVVLDYSGTGGTPFWLKGDWVVVDGLEVTGATEYGIAVVGTHLTIQNCRLYGNNDDAIKLLYGAEYVEIAGCTFTDSTHNAIDCFGSYVDIHDCQFLEGGSGIVMKGGCHDNSIHDCIFDGCNPLGAASDWTYSAVSLGGWSKLTYKHGEYEAENCSCNDNIFKNMSCSGIYFWEARDCEARRNTITNIQGYWGIAAFGNPIGDGETADDRHQSTNVTLTDNIVSASGAAESQSRGVVYIADGNEVGLVADYNQYWRDDGATETLVYGGTPTTNRIATDLAGWQEHFCVDEHSTYAEVAPEPEPEPVEPDPEPEPVEPEPDPSPELIATIAIPQSMTLAIMRAADGTISVVVSE